MAERGQREVGEWYVRPHDKGGYEAVEHGDAEHEIDVVTLSTLMSGYGERWQAQAIADEGNRRRTKAARKRKG